LPLQDTTDREAFILLYKEFRDAAKRHLETCQFMLGNLGTLKNKPSERYILINIYYLGGYVIECIVKYAIYALAGYSRDRDIKELNRAEHGLSYEEDITHHNFRSLIDKHLSKTIKVKETSLLQDRKNDVTKLCHEWGPEVRYTYKGKNIDKKLINEFIEKVDEAHAVIKSAVGG
jgi:hypothetical protein